MKKNLCRVYDLKSDNPDFLNPIVDYVKSHKDKYFLAFRVGRITVYYKGRETITLTPKTKEKWMIKPRNLSKGIKYQKINEKYKKSPDKAGFTLNQQQMNIQKDYLELLQIASDFLDDYYENNEEEKTIQNDIACKYQCSNNSNLLCIDQEYNQCFINQNAKDESDIKGRFDLIMLKKVGDIYKLLFVELKSRLSSCYDSSSGVINHLSDYHVFLENYKESKTDTKEIIKKGICFAVEQKKKYGYIDASLSINQIDFDNPEFYILFQMTEDEYKNTPKTREDIEILIDNELKRAEHIERIYNDSKGKKNTKDYERLVRMSIKIGNKQLKNKLELCDNKKLIQELKKEVIEISYYSDFKPIEI